MVKNQTQRRRIPGLASLFTIHFIEHAIRKVAPSLEKEEPLRDFTKQVEVGDRKEDYKGHYSVDEAYECEQVWRNPVWQALHKLVCHWTVEPLVKNSLV